MAHPLFANFSAGRFSGGNSGGGGAGSGGFGTSSDGPRKSRPFQVVGALVRDIARQLMRTIEGLAGNNPELANRLVDEAVARLRPELEDARRTQAPPQRPAPGGSRSTGDARNFVRVGGRIFKAAPDDPLLTGEMVPVTSSNVHSIGYDFNRDAPTKGTLKVRFLQSDRKSGSKAKVPGPLYQYFDVHPFIFMAMRDAASKGKFVWDKLRIRGTVSGHRYNYRLAGIAQGYVPRQASLRSQAQEWFVQRSIRVGGQVLRSQLPTQLVRTLDARKHHEILISGAPYRGSPVRGQPFRGR